MSPRAAGRQPPSNRGGGPWVAHRCPVAESRRRPRRAAIRRRASDLPPPPPRQRIPRGPAPRRRAGRPELTDAAVVSRSWGMAVATLVSRITGFTRIVLLAAILGAALSSAFSVANQLPNLVAALVLEATFTAIFVPVLARAERDDPDGGTAFVRRLVTLATALLLVATVLSVAAAPLLVRLMLGSDPQVNRPLTTAFAYLLLPQVLFYGLSSVFMAILNTRNVFGPPAWAPVVNNVVAIATLGVYLACAGRTFGGPRADGQRQAARARHRHDAGRGRADGGAARRHPHANGSACARCGASTTASKQFGAMAGGHGALRVDQPDRPGRRQPDRQRRSGFRARDLQLHVAGADAAVRHDRRDGADGGDAAIEPQRRRRTTCQRCWPTCRLATRLTMVTLIPIVAFMTVGGPAIGSALFAYGNFGDVDAGYLGMAISLSAFTLIPYALVLLQLRVFYAREQPWTPIVVIVVITTVKIAASLAAPHLTDDRELVAGYLGLANGIGFLAGAIVGYILLRANLNPPGRRAQSAWKSCAPSWSRPPHR